MTNTSVESTEGLVLVTLLVGWGLFLLLRRLRRRRRDMDIGRPLAVAFGVRLLAIAAVNASGSSAGLRGGDENTFLTFAHDIATTPFGRGFLPHGPYQLQTDVFALQIKLLNPGDTALRVTQVGLALVGMVLVVAAVHDLAGRRASRLAAWLLALEPGAVFFDSVLHKEPLMTLAGGLVVYGGTKLWQRLSPQGVLLCALGGLIAVETRSYAGWFMVGGATLVLLHAALRHLDRPELAMPVVYAIVVALILTTPTLLRVTSNQSLKKLQASQTANSTSTGAGNNLALEQVNFSTRSSVIANLPKRIRDLLLKPYPWQLGSTSQKVGAIGSIVALIALVLLLRYAWRARSGVTAATGPLIYPLLFMTIAYSLSAGNAGTGFRYRTHLVMIWMAMLSILRTRVLARAEATEAQGALPAGSDPQTAYVPAGGRGTVPVGVSR